MTRKTAAAKRGRPSNVKCRTCKAQVPVGKRGPVPVYCAACSGHQSTDQANAREPAAASSLPLGLPLAPTDEQMTNHGLTADARRTLARIIAMLDAALPTMSPAQYSPAAKTMLEVVKVLSGDTLAQDFATLNVVIGRQGDARSH